MIQLQAHPEGTILPIRAQPSARANALRGEQDGMLKVSVTQAPEKGKANKAIAALLRERLGLRGGQLEWIGGETSSKKLLLVRGVAPDALARQLAAAMEE